jgi:hypothetical protein
VNSTAILFWLFVLACLLSVGLIAGIISLSWVYSYEEILLWSENRSYDLIRLEEENLATFKYQNYLLSRWISILLLLSVPGLLIISYRNTEVIFMWLKNFSRQAGILYSKFVHAFRYDNGVIRNYMLIVITIIVWQIRNYFYFPFFVDDLASYVYFARNGPLITAVFYPIPNNHIFYNLLSSVATTFINDPLLSTRLISFVSFHMLILVLFVYLYRSFSNKWIAYLAVAICGFFFASSIYSIQGRGYMIFSLFTVSAGISLLKYVETRQALFLVIVIVSSILGAYTVPTFLIPFIGLIAVFLFFSIYRRDKILLQDAFICASCVGIGVFLLYLPTFIFSGIGAITSNKFVVSDSRNDFFTYAFPVASAEVFSITAGVNTKGWLVLLLLGLLSIPLFKNKQTNARNWFILSFSILGSILLYNFVTRSFMPLRVITYASFFVYVSYAIVLAYWIEKIRAKRLVYIGILLLIPFIGWWQYNHTVYLSYLFPERIHEVTREFVDRIIYDGETAHISKELKYFHWYYIYRNDIAEERVPLKSHPLSADLIFLTYEEEHLLMEGYLLIEIVKGIEYSPDYYIYKKIPR